MGNLQIPDYNCVFYFDGLCIINANRTATIGHNVPGDICVEVAYNNIDTLSGVLTLKVVLDNKEPYFDGIYVYPKHQGVE